LKDFLKEIAINNQDIFILINNNKVIDMKPVNLPNHLTQFYKANRTRYDNYALAVEKFGRFHKNKLEYMHPNGEKLCYTYKHNDDLITKIEKKQEHTISLLKKERYKVVEKKMKQNWRMALGLGNGSAYNNGFTFHPVYGIPYIPGQALKGIVRSYIIREFFNKKESKAEQDPVFCYLFGCSEKGYDKTARAGKLNFLDAFPTNEFKLVPDIMNPHYSEYYGDQTGSKAPVDSEKLIPIFFLSLKDAQFNFVFYIKAKYDNTLRDLEFKIDKETSAYQNYPDNLNLFNTAKKPSDLVSEILKDALIYQGIGAKTAVGYGRFEEI
jgi:CRISPR-associated protein Cmr6